MATTTKLFVLEVTDTDLNCKRSSGFQSRNMICISDYTHSDVHDQPSILRNRSAYIDVKTVLFSVSTIVDFDQSKQNPIDMFQYQYEYLLIFLNLF